MNSHAPAGYQCPFCRIAGTLDSPTPDPAVVLIQPRVFVLVPLHHYGSIRGNCLVIPRGHYENVFDIAPSLGSDLLQATRDVAEAMRSALACEGISTRQHNGPAGDQDVWHFHQHVFPRYSADSLWAGQKVAYEEDERLALAAKLRNAMGSRGHGPTT